MQKTIQGLVAHIREAAEEAADFQKRFATEDSEARKIVDIMERFLRSKGRVVYGGAAINAHLPADRKFYDPTLYLPDYDFMTPDPLQDCADLITTFQQEGFVDVEAKYGLHEGTYKIFVNYRSAADVTYMPSDIYDRLMDDAVLIDGIQYASVNYLRMQIYLELSRPAGDVGRWEKVYERLLMLNEIYPLKAGRCAAQPISQLADDGSVEPESDIRVLHDRIVGIGIEVGAIFLNGVSYLQDLPPNPSEVCLMISDKATAINAELKAALGLRPTVIPNAGELMPARMEWRTSRRRLVAVVFETVACHSYVTLPQPVGYRLGSLDLLIQMYYAFYFMRINAYIPVRLLCLIQELIDMQAKKRSEAAKSHAPAHDVFPLECIGHQPTLPELKRAHRQRVREKQKQLNRLVRTRKASKMMSRYRTRRN
jgi:hypothetical protein